MKLISTITHSLAGTCTALLLLSVSSTTSLADVTIKKGIFESDLIVSADELVIEAEIKGDLIAAGGRVDVNSIIKGDTLVMGGEANISNHIDGDLMLMSGRSVMDATVMDSASIFVGKVKVTGDINGDALAIGGKLIFAGDIKGDLRATGGKIEIRKNVGGNVLASGGILSIKDTATINGKATLGAGTVRVDGHILGDLRVGAGEVIISGRIDGDAKIAARTITILPSAHIAGNLIYHSPDAIQLSDQAEIGGDVTFSQSEGMMEREGGLFALAGATHIVLIIGLVLLASAFVLALPKLFPAMDRQSHGRNWVCFALGVGVLIGVPLLIFLLFITAIGVPIAVMLTAIYFVMVITGQFGSSYVMGRRLMSWCGVNSTSKPLHRVGATALGLSVLWILALVPILGAVFIIWATARGVGSLVFEILELRARVGQPVST